MAEGFAGEHCYRLTRLRNGDGNGNGWRQYLISRLMARHFSTALLRRHYCDGCGQ